MSDATSLERISNQNLAIMGWGSGTSGKCPFCKKKKAKKNLGHCGSWGCKSKAAASGMGSIDDKPKGVADHRLNFPCGHSKSIAVGEHKRICAWARKHA